MPTNPEIRNAVLLKTEFFAIRAEIRFIHPILFNTVKNEGKAFDRLAKRSQKFENSYASIKFPKSVSLNCQGGN